ncbi:MAG: S41 family peptidase [Parcubacteria group bacterium]|nr:S41 family peptidase [Parcubacteria group bacterium]
MKHIKVGENTQKLATGVIVVALVGIAFLIGLYAGGNNSDSNAYLDAEQPQSVDLKPVWKVWNLLSEKYAAATTTVVVTDQTRVWGMIQGLTDSLGDPYTVFLPPAESELFESDISGNFEGVGMEIGLRDKILTVIAPLKGTPAYNSGIKSGDKILRIDDTETSGLSIDRAVKLIRGERGTEVTFTIFRDGTSEPLTIGVIRDVIEIPTINVSQSEGAGLRDDGIYVIALYNFSAISQNLFREALRSFINSGSNKLILDLRGNPGGFLGAAVDMASWFLPTGKVVVSENFGDERKANVHRSRGYNIFNDNLKLAILVNGGSASASEILAGALSEHGKAILVGERTFGKGSVQELIKITDDTSLKVTVARWLTPDGKSISDGGLTPDIVVELDGDKFVDGIDTQLEAAAEYLKSI